MTEKERKEKKRLYDIEYRKRNKEKLKKQKEEWAKNNPEKVKASRDRNKDKKKERDVVYYEKNKEKIYNRRREWAKNNPEKVKASKKRYYENNKDKCFEYVKQRIDTDPLYKLSTRIRKSVYDSIKRMGYSKRSKTSEILGCTFEEFKEHIESQWEDWMSWDNYGKYNGEEGCGWDIDHIIPISSAINESEVIKLNHFTNLQPLCSKINRDIKRDIILD